MHEFFAAAFVARSVRGGAMVATSFAPRPMSSPTISFFHEDYNCYECTTYPLGSLLLCALCVKLPQKMRN